MSVFYSHCNYFYSFVCSSSVAHESIGILTRNRLIDYEQTFVYYKANRCVHRLMAHFPTMCKRPEVVHQTKRLFINAMEMKNIYYMSIHLRKQFLYIYVRWQHSNVVSNEMYARLYVFRHVYTCMMLRSLTKPNHNYIALSMLSSLYRAREKRPWPGHVILFR